MVEMWEFGDRGWASITVGLAADGVTGQGSPGKDNEHKGLAGWNFAGLDWYFVIGLIVGFDFVVDRFGVVRGAFDNDRIGLYRTWGRYWDLVIPTSWSGGDNSILDVRRHRTSYRRGYRVSGYRSGATDFHSGGDLGYRPLG